MAHRLILSSAGVQRDKEGRLLPDFEQHKIIAWIITAAGVRALDPHVGDLAGLRLHARAALADDAVVAGAVIE